MSAALPRAPNGRADVVIIGAGVIGVSVAYALAGRGRRVLVLDGRGVGAGCSAGNAGLVVPSHSVPLAAPGMVAAGLRSLFDPRGAFRLRLRPELSFLKWLWRFRAACREERVRRAIPVLRDLARASAALYAELEARGDLGAAFVQRGLLMVYRTARGLGHGRDEAALLAEFGVGAQVLAPEAAREREPLLRPDLAGAVLYPEDGHFDPAAVVSGLAAAAVRRGVRFEARAEVTGFERAGGRVIAARTAAGPVEGDAFVLAAGADSGALGRALGISLPVVAGKGVSITLPSPRPAPRMPLLLVEARVAVTPLPGDRLRLGGTMELGVSTLAPAAARLKAVRSGAQRYLDGLDEGGAHETWAGLRPCTPDGLPIVGKLPALDNLWIATGHAMLGMTLGPVTGEIVAALMCGEPPPVDPALLDPGRWASA